MYLTDLHKDEPKAEEIAKQLLTVERRTEIKEAIAALVNEELDRLEVDAAYFLTDLAARRAEAFIERLLKGDEDAAKALFGTGEGGYRQAWHKAGQPWAQLINGKLFQTSSMTLLQGIVDANPDLLRNNRIKDLESVVEGLSIQIRELTERLKRR
jgi:hypothetical protein